VPTELEGSAGRLDAVLAAALGITRAEAQRAIAAGLVLVDGVPRPKSHRLEGGERITVELEPLRAVPPEPGPLRIVYRDPHLAIVDKPAGLPTHPTEGRRTGTLVNRLLAAGLPLADVGDPLRPGIVHRLDAGTSGLLVVACSEQARAGLAGMLRRHELDRRYLALVRGELEHDRFVVDAPLGRRGARVRVAAVTGRPAETAFEVRERFPGATLVEAAPRTGRTHQIRVHLAAIGHPILGDRRYGGGGADAERLGLARPFLHSARLAFVHPVTGEPVRVEIGLPEDLAEALRRVRGEG
jgi:23S rRNA pseudouridine1911/1915/1917 synthase